MKKNSNFFLIFLLLLISSCNQFSRFNYESYRCGNNLSSINEIILGKVKEGSILKLKNGLSNYEVKIDNVSGKEVFFTLENKKLSIHRETGRLHLKENNNLIIIDCKISKFKM